MFCVAVVISCSVNMDTLGSSIRHAGYGFYLRESANNVQGRFRPIVRVMQGFLLRNAGEVDHASGTTRISNREQYNLVATPSVEDCCIFECGEGC